MGGDSHLGIESESTRAGPGAGEVDLARRLERLERENEALAARLERTEFLFHEVDHRVRNTLAAVQGIAERIARQAPTPAAFLAAFRPRLTALAQAHEILASERWAGARLSRLVRMSVEPYLTEPGQLVWMDDDLLLPGRVATPVFMALHELATNAAKHGALSVPEGRVRVDARVHRERAEMELVWQESGGPVVPPSEHEGFGMTVIRRGLAHELGGRVDVHMEPAGLRAHLAFPVEPEVLDRSAGSCA